MAKNFKEKRNSNQNDNIMSQTADLLLNQRNEQKNQNDQRNQGQQKRNNNNANQKKQNQEFKD